MKKLLSFAIGILLLCGALFGCNKLLNQKANDGGNKTLTIYTTLFRSDYQVRA